ncbi:MAG TPA: DUF547 domain-containing protein [Chitinophagales bacterium]|nr:DUF547 domain-containing protein [Chitinophagales bacterium]
MTFILSIIISFLNFYPSSFSVPAKPATVSHDAWNDLLKKYVTPDGKVNYQGIQHEKSKLESYLGMLSRNPPQENWQRNEVMAYWINAYNAFTVKLILDYYPVKSILDIDKGKAWDDVFIKIGDKSYTLDNIENDILRKKFNDPRIHFAINCASKSCPKLLNEAYTPDKLDLQLSIVAKNFVNDPSKNKITADKIEVSKIFEWNKNDFTTGETLIDFLNHYSNKKIQQNATISFLDYDWSLNE